MTEVLQGCLAEAILASGAALLFLLQRRGSRLCADVALMTVAASAVGAVASMDAPWGFLLEHLLVVDPFASLTKLVLSLTAMVAVWMSSRSGSSGAAPQTNWAMFLLCLLGMDLLVGSVHLVGTWLALEMVNLCGLLWVASHRGVCWPRSLAVRMLLEGAVASLLFLLGVALLFGFSGVLDYPSLAGRLSLATAAPGGKVVLFLGFAFLLVGAVQRLAAVPWFGARAEMAEHGTLAMSAWFETATTIAGAALLIRFLRAVSDPGMDGTWQVIGGVDWPVILSLVAMGSMTIGNLAALRESNLKRLLAWWSVAQSGYLLMGLAAPGDYGVQAVVLHGICYAAMMCGALIALEPLEESAGHPTVEVLRGLARRSGAARATAVLLATFLLSLAAIPPLAGHVGKTELFAVAIRADQLGLASIAALNSLLVLLCCARLIVTMLDRPSDQASPVRLDMETALLGGLLLLGTVGFGLWPAGLISFVERSTAFFSG